MQMRAVAMLEVVSVPAMKKVTNSSIKSVTVQQSFFYMSVPTLLSSFSLSSRTSLSINPPPSDCSPLPIFSLALLICLWMISVAYSLNFLLFWLTSRSIFLSGDFTKQLPRKKAQREKDLSVFCSNRLLMQVKIQVPSSFSSWISPKKHFITTFPQIRWNMLFTSITTAQPEALLGICSISLIFSSTMEAIVLILDLMKSQLKTPLMMRFLLFHSAPSLKSRPLPRMEKSESMRGMSVDFSQQPSRVRSQNCRMSSGSIRSTKIILLKLERMTWQLLYLVLTVQWLSLQSSRSFFCLPKFPSPRTLKGLTKVLQADVTILRQTWYCLQGLTILAQTRKAMAKTATVAARAVIEMDWCKSCMKQW